MLQNFNYFNEHEDYNIRLCNPNMEQICLLNFGYEKEVFLRFNDVSEFHITIPYYYNDNIFQFYDMVASKRIISIDGLKQFLITEVNEIDDGIEKKKEVTAYSLEMELSFKKINLFDGTYKFYDLLNPENTLLYKVLETSNWTVGEIDPDLLNLYRTFEIPDSTVYEFLLNEVENSYECVFVFDTFNKTVSAYTLPNLVNNTDILLTYENLIQRAQITEKSDEIVTALSVYGGNDLGISAVNPLGSNTIYNFDYFKTTEWMSQDLINALNNWESNIEQSSQLYASLLTQYKNNNANLVELKSTLEDQKTERDSIEGVIKVMIEGGLTGTSEYTQQVQKLNAINQTIENTNSQISSLETTLSEILEDLSEINQNLSFENNFTDSQYSELKSYIIENTYQNDSFTITSTMTNEEIQDMSQQLYDQGNSVLIRVSQPRFEFSIDSVNFLFLKEFQYFSQQLELGCIINIQKDEGYILTPILLEIQYQLDDPENFSLTFGNRYRLDTAEYTFKELFGDAIRAGSSVKFDSGKWGEYVNSGMNDTVTNFINSALDTSKNNVINATNQEIIINQNGLRGRVVNSNSDGYMPEQVWLTSNTLAFTNDNWDTCSLALGKVNFNGTSLYGLVADAIVGKIIAGNQLQITNENNNFILDSNGAVLNNASFSLVTENGLGQIFLDPSNGISIQTRNNTNSDWVNNFYIDSNGNVTMNGKITASSGTIGGWQISDTKLYNTANGDYIGSNGYGKLSLLSWTPTSATFNGRIYASNLGDQIKTNNIQNGAVTSQKLDTVYATKAFVDSINADVAKLGNVVATKASIDDLNATNARITNLDITNLKFQGRTANWQFTTFIHDVTANRQQVRVQNTNGEWITISVCTSISQTARGMYYISDS